MSPAPTQFVTSELTAPTKACGREALARLRAEHALLAAMRLGDDVDEPFERRAPLLDQAGPGGVDLDEEHPRERRRARAAAADRRRARGPGDRAGRARRSHAPVRARSVISGSDEFGVGPVGRLEAVLAAREQLVERGPRDAGLRDDVGDRRLHVAPLGHDHGRCVQQSLRCRSWTSSRDNPCGPRGNAAGTSPAKSSRGERTDDRRG